MDPRTIVPQICDWQIQRERLSERGKYILQSGLWSDCSFIVGIEPNQREFKAHKLIMSMASPVFDTMFHTSLQEKDHNIEISDIQAEAFANLLKYIYTDELRLESFDQACELCYVANKYMMPFLVRHCTSYIWKDVDHTSVCRAYEFARLFDQDHLLERCKQIIRNETSMVLSHPNFLEADHSTVTTVMDQNYLSISGELELFQALQRWVDAECLRRGVTEGEERRKLGEGLVGKVRYLAMDVREVAEGPALSGLLRESEALAVLLGAASTTAAVARPWPPTFDSRTAPRRPPPPGAPTNPPLLFKIDMGPLTPFHNPGGVQKSIVFTVTKDATLDAVQVLKQLYVSGGGDDEEPPSYQEDATVWVEDEIAKHRIASSKSTICSGFNLTMEISIMVQLKKDRLYRVGVVLGASGWYVEGLVSPATLNLKDISLNLLPDSCSHTSPIYALLISPSCDQVL